ncbi:hypothetical protein D3C72_1644670 [compost metagenome]
MWSEQAVDDRAYVPRETFRPHWRSAVPEASKKASPQITISLKEINPGTHRFNEKVRNRKNIDLFHPTLPYAQKRPFFF